MGVKGLTGSILRSFVKRYGYEILPTSTLYEWQGSSPIKRSSRGTKLPVGAEEYLQNANPRLRELESRYSMFNRNATTPLIWTDAHVGPDDLKYFRGDNAYVWQLRGKNMNILAYALTYYYLKSIDTLSLLKRMDEDDNFGIHHFVFDEKLVTRDLLDSIIEIYFLQKHLNILNRDNMKVLDIGAGYGRLAHRMVQSMDSIDTFLCTDAVPVSTFISEYYIRFRNIENRAKIVPLYEIESVLEKCKVDIALNIHSFSECTLEAIDWWLNIIERSAVKYLMVVPNAVEEYGKVLLTNTHQDFSRLIESHGYKLVIKEPKYRDPFIQQYGINPTYHHLYELQ